MDSCIAYVLCFWKGCTFIPAKRGPIQLPVTRTNWPSDVAQTNLPSKIEEPPNYGQVPHLCQGFSMVFLFRMIPRSWTNRKTGQVNYHAISMAKNLSSQVWNHQPGKTKKGTWRIIPPSKSLISLSPLSLTSCDSPNTSTLQPTPETPRTFVQHDPPGPSNYPLVN